MVLHIFAKGLNHRSLLAKCQAISGPDDAIIFIEDGTFWVSDSPLATPLLEVSGQLYYLQEHAEARDIKHILAPVKPVDYEEFVKLTVQYKSSLSWF